jgi:hypothetical protein
MTSTNNLCRGEYDGDPFWHDEGGNTVRVAPSDDGGVHVWATDWGNEYGPRLGTDEIRDLASHLLALCDEIDRVKDGRIGLIPGDYEQLAAWNAARAARRDGAR